MDNNEFKKFDKLNKDNAHLHKAEGLYVIMCISFLETMAKAILTSPFAQRDRWKTIYRKIKKLECDVTDSKIAGHGKWEDL